MAYNNAPFNYYGESPNQVLEDLTKANENFTILGTAFISNDPGTATVKNSDKVDGYHASQTPSPNTIPVADSTGKIHRDWLPQLDGTSSSVDYRYSVAISFLFGEG